MEKFDRRYAHLLVKEEGMSWPDAVFVASATIGGAVERPDGTIHATQTACEVLNYDENCPGSLGAAMGRRVTTRNLIRFAMENPDEAHKWS